jgi:DNA-binding transcriptional LysR family regulator
MAPAFGIELVPAAIASYLSKHPETSFEIETLHYQQVARALKQSRVDIGMVFDPLPVPGIAIEHLASAECVAITHKSMDFGIKRRLTLNDLDGIPFVNMNTRSPLGRLLASRRKANNIRFKNVANVETYQMAKALVAEGAGVSIIDEITARSTGHKDVIAWKLQPPLEFNIAILHIEREPLSIVTQHFVEHLKAAVNEFLKT